MTRTPKSAPRCPRCHYNLYGLKPPLHCPECGWVARDWDDVSEARFLADENAADRAAMRNQWIAAIVGMAFIVIGMTVGAIASAKLTLWRGYWTCAILTVGYLWYRVRIGEPMYLTLLLIGGLWLILGIILSSF